MPNFAKTTTCNVIPTMRYRDAPAMIDWLCRALGFTVQAVYEDGSGGIAHAQLVFGTGMIMLGSVKDHPLHEYLVQPEEVGNRNTQTSCLIVDDCDAHYAQAVAAGAEIIDPISDKEYGGRGYGCRDPEGQVWWIGSYDPWQEHTA
jgi:uncharacterized glyoxalase superfamily protein PhnB